MGHSQSSISSVCLSVFLVNRLLLKSKRKCDLENRVLFINIQSYGVTWKWYFVWFMLSLLEKHFVQMGVIQDMNSSTSRRIEISAAMKCQPLCKEFFTEPRWKWILGHCNSMITLSSLSFLHLEPIALTTQFDRSYFKRTSKVLFYFS